MRPAGCVARASSPKRPPIGRLAQADSGFVLRDELLSEAVEFGSQVRRLEDFDLRQEWEIIAANIAELRGEQTVSVLAEPRAVSWLHAQFGKDRVSVQSTPTTTTTTDDGRLHVEITFPTTHTPVAELAGLTPAVEVLEPANLRTELHSLGQQLVKQYKP
jgi:hypothetical protein